MSAGTALWAWGMATEAGTTQQELGLWSWPIEMMRACLRTALPSASKGKSKVEFQSPRAFPVPRAEGKRAVAMQGRASLATSSPCSASAD